MSVADFAMTVAVGSVLASAVDPKASLPVVLIGLATLFLCQWLVAFARTRFAVSREVLDNDPLPLMANGRILESNMKSGQVAKADLFAKLRESNVLNLSQVRAVVLETTGDISVIHSSDPSEHLQQELFFDVRDSEYLNADER